MIFLLVLAALAQAAPSTEPDSGPTFYVCQVDRSGEFGKIFYTMEVPVDGSEPFHRIQWHIPTHREEGLQLHVQWNGAPPANGSLDDRSWVFVSFRTTRFIRDKVRIEIRRMPGERYPPEFAYAGPFQKAYRWPNSKLYHVDTQGRWGELNAWMAGRESLTFALVKRDGTVIAEDRLEAQTLTAAARAIAAAGPEVGAMAADYRRRCEVPSPIVISSAFYPVRTALHRQTRS